MIIKKIEIKDKNAKIILDNGNDFVITLETYLNNTVLVDNEINEGIINDLKNQDNLSVARNHLLGKISRKKLSKQESIDILKEHEVSDDSIMKIIEELEKNYLINDLELAEFVVDYCLSNKKGINKIKEKLKERKLNINYDEFLMSYLDSEKYQKNVLYLINKYGKMAANKSQKELKNYIVIKMINNGYENSDFVHLVNDFCIDEKQGIVKEVKKYFKKEEKNRENIAKITKKLLSKGFKYDIIREVIRECEEDETN